MALNETTILDKKTSRIRRVSELLSELHHVSIHESMSDIIYKDIVRKVFNRELKQGQRITESQITKEFHVSSIPVREAIFKLERDGWIERIPNKGSYVSDYKDKEKLKELFLVRKNIELGAFYSLVKNATDQQLNHLESLIKDIEVAYENKQLNQYREADSIYHCTVVLYANGRQMEEYFEQVLLKCGAFVDYPENPEDFMKYPLETHQPTHRVIHEALRARDLLLVLQLVDKHTGSGAQEAGIDI
jgi:DNA-binding GntR family transcriptional regulator